jgi:hypothetical protein
MDRRQFLQLSAVGVVTGFTQAGTSHDSLELLPLLGPESVRELGRRYREMAPAAAPFAAGRWRASVDSVRDDFAHGRTVLIDGWVLSLTEARQCALFSLLPG